VITNTVADSEQRAVILAVDAIEIFGVEAPVAQVEIDAPMRAAIQIGEDSGFVAQHEAFEGLAALFEREPLRLAERQASRARDAQPPRPLAQASVLRDGPGV
jgi:hypothetical protein